MSTRNVIVTGGTGALGSAVTASFLETGDRVVVPWIVPEEEKLLRERHAREAADGRLILLEADVSEDAGARACVDAAGAPDVLVNGVGGFAGGPPVAETGLDVWDRMYRMNVRTAAACCRAVAPGMSERGRGVIVSVCSQAAFAKPAGLAAYSASKAAIAVLTETLQAELGARGVRVGAVVPSTIDTPANREAMPDADPADWTAPAAIAGVIQWFASDAAATVKGALIPV